MPSKAAQILTRKIGPAPLWGWVVAAIVAFLVFRYAKAAGGGAASPQPTTSGGTGSDLSGSGGGAVTGGGSAGGASGGVDAAGLLQALSNGTFGVHDAYNTYAPTTTTTYAPTTTIDYGSGNSFPPAGGTAPGGGPGVGGGVTVVEPPTGATGTPPSQFNLWPVNPNILNRGHVLTDVPQVALDFTGRSLLPSVLREQPSTAPPNQSPPSTAAGMFANPNLLGHGHVLT